MIKIFQYFSGTPHDCRQWIFGDVDGKIRFKPEAFVQAFEEGAAAGQHDAAVENVRRELRGHSF